MTTEKKVTIGIDVRGKNFNHKAKYALSLLRREIQKHFRTTNFAISTAINEYIWNKGRINTPNKVTLIGVEKNAKVYLFLDTPEDLKKKNELLAGKKGDVKDEKETVSKSSNSGENKKEENKTQQKTESKPKVENPKKTAPKSADKK